MVAAALAALLAGRPARAQEADYATRCRKANAQVVKLLTGFARRATVAKSPARARVAYRYVVHHYEPDHQAARQGLGFARAGSGWRRTGKPLPRDAILPRNAGSLDRAWRTTLRRAAAVHRKLGAALLKQGDTRNGRAQFERVLLLVPSDKKSHQALGHRQQDGFFGSERDLQFVQRMRALRRQAAACAAHEFETEALPKASMPELLRKSGIAFAGARCQNFTCWLAGSQEEAANFAQWQARALRLMQWLTSSAEDADGAIYLGYRYVAVLRTADQRERLLASDPVICNGDSLAQAMRYSSCWYWDDQKHAEWMLHDAAQDADAAVAQFTKRGLVANCNEALSEGLVHAMTSLLCGTVSTFYATLAQTVASADEPVARTVATWTKELDRQIRTGTDWPLAELPLERLEKFREPCRIKAWSFTIWLLAREPKRWFALATQLQRDELTQEVVAEAFEGVLDFDLRAVDAAWREWARDGSAIGKAARR